MGLLARRQMKFQKAAARANSFVSRFYGVAPLPIGTVEITMPRGISELTAFGFCDAETGDVKIPVLSALRSSKAQTFHGMAHETAHRYVNDTELGRQYVAPADLKAGYASAFAGEGLAELAAVSAPGKPREAWDWILDFCIGIPLHPIKFLEFISSKIVSKLPEKWIAKIGNAADKVPVLCRWLWPYTFGLRFAKAVCNCLGPEKTFKLVTESPPSTMSEICDPKVYLSARAGKLA